MMYKVTVNLTRTFIIKHLFRNANVLPFWLISLRSANLEVKVHLDNVKKSKIDRKCIFQMRIAVATRQKL